MRYLIREPRELQRTINKALHENYIWDLLTQCHGTVWPYDMSYSGTEEQCKQYRIHIANMLRKVADEVEHSPIEATDDDTDICKGINIDYGGVPNQ